MLTSGSIRRRVLVCALGASAAIALTACDVKTTSSGGGGQSYPKGNVQFSVGSSAGGSTDLITRALAMGMSKQLSVAMPVVNKPGANGALNAKELQGAPADGYKVAVQNASLFTITPLTVSAAEATSIDKFDVITGISRDDYVMATSAQSGFKSIEDLKKSGKTVRYGTTGVGTGAQLASALTFKSAGITATAVPFDGGAPALTALLGNQVDVSTMQIGEGIENIKAGKLVPLAVFSAQRVAFLPDVRTAKEQGFDVQVTQYRFLTAPKGTPEDAKARLLDAAKKTFTTDEYKKFNEENSLTPMEVSPQDVLGSLQGDSAKYRKQLDEFGISLAG
ncbi:tripartite-type tricarboxylate transporter receptor subunit TctC [Kibdelosporangium banguiense]|uniref:Tripartite-type tricarboxylate transporter receptor subunit TctC n=1 Tax=Kibdelosporangium banguiense TaxID=1365924 RepID=A0ABS4TRC1_9PSEU|nr:tripartite tricarboxylate transporter substrate binding protein [Kibdelosporangium banguiense]MBP2326426.1 tripartite-type tricarboxylate transporter receptor subunit TctC [Kibdelosporangium banguiense]